MKQTYRDIDGKIRRDNIERELIQADDEVSLTESSRFPSITRDNSRSNSVYTTQTIQADRLKDVEVDQQTVRSTGQSGVYSECDSDSIDCEIANVTGVSNEPNWNDSYDEIIENQAVLFSRDIHDFTPRFNATSADRLVKLPPARRRREQI